MAIVFLNQMLADQYACGQQQHVFQVDSVRRLVEALDEAFPGLGHEVAEHSLLAIDGQMMQSAFFAPLTASSEVHVFPKMAAG